MERQIRVLYSCHLCGLDRVSCNVPVRESEDIMIWFDGVMMPALVLDHTKRSPGCKPEKLAEVMIPIEGAERIGELPKN